MCFAYVFVFSGFLVYSDWSWGLCSCVCVFFSGAGFVSFFALRISAVGVCCWGHSFLCCMRLWGFTLRGRLAGLGRVCGGCSWRALPQAPWFDPSKFHRQFRSKHSRVLNREVCVVLHVQCCREYARIFSIVGYHVLYQRGVSELVSLDFIY